MAAARALVTAGHGEGLELQHLDILQFLAPPLRIVFREAYFDLVARAPDLVNWLADLTDRRPAEEKSRMTRTLARLSRRLVGRFPRYVGEYRPDLLLHTHFLAPALLAANRKLGVPQAEVITDYQAHSFWLQQNIYKYFVATEEMRVHLESAGIDPGRILVSGIPIDERFSHLKPKAEQRRALELSVERDVLLLIASGLNKTVFFDLLFQLKNLKWPATVVVICGRSTSYEQLAQASLEDYEGLLNFKVLRYTPDMPEYMAAADLVIGKPGGLTTTESLAAGLPFAIVDPYPVQEVSNAAFLLEQGVGFNLEPLTVLPYKIKAYLEDGSRRETMQARALEVAKPDAAVRILRSLGPLAFK
ncbi:MAG: glycosyltransferase [Trueperaceae bacterium]|nr:MAG: glycosyltransferase [Trueperaceae bacterium]